MATLRRRGIHPPQLVGRLSPPRPNEDPALTLKRLIGEFDSAMQELQRFLKYQQDANDSGQVGSGIEGVVDGSVEQYLKEKAFGGLASEIPIHTHSGPTEAGVVHHGALTGLGDDDHTQYLTKPRHDAIDAADHASGTADDGFVLTADGAGGAAWESGGAGGPHAASHEFGGGDPIIIENLSTGILATTKYLYPNGVGGVDWANFSHLSLLDLEGGAGGHYFHMSEISRGGTVLAPAGAIDIIVWRAPFACTVTAVKGYRSGGTGATINARRNGTSDHLASDLSLTSADTWMDGGAVQNTAYVAGDKLEIRVVTVAGSPSEIGIQVDLVRT